MARWRVEAGRRLLVIEHERFRIGLWPDLGGAIAHYVDRATGCDIIWRNPYGSPPRRHVLDLPLVRGSDLYDVMDGSWYVSLPSGSHATDYFGAPMGLHGELRSLPWTVERVTQSAAELTVVLVGRSVRTPFVYRRELRVRRGQAYARWRESVENRAGEALPVAWLQHPTFGGPLVDGARLVTPARTVVSSPDKSPGAQLKSGYRGPWPLVPERRGGGRRDCRVVPAAGSGIDHSVQLTDFPAGWGCIWNGGRRLGFGLAWDATVFPWAWSWANGGGLRHYPLWGEGHLITLQPSTSPMGDFRDLVRRGDVLTIPARGTVATTLVTGFVAAEDAPATWAKEIR